MPIKIIQHFGKYWTFKMMRIFEYFIMFILVVSINVFNTVYGTSYTIYLVPIFVFYFFIKNDAHFIINKNLIPLFCIILLGFIFITFSAYDIQVALTHHRRILFNVMYMLLIFWYSRQSLNHTINIFRFYLFSFFLAIFLVFFGTIDFYSTTRLDYSSSVNTLNANYYGYLAFAGIVSSTAIFFTNKSKLNQGLVLLTFFLGIIINILTASRAGFLVIILLFLIYYLSSSFRLINKNFFLIFLLIFPILLSVIYFFSYLNILLADTFLLSRLLQSNVEDLRYLHIVEGIKIFTNNFILGIGPGNYPLLNEVSSMNNSHNTFIEISVSYGFIGTLLYLYFFYNFLIQKVSNKFILFKIIFLVGFILYHFFYIIYLSPLFMGLAMNYLVFTANDQIINRVD